MAQERVGQVWGAAGPLDASVGLSITSARVGPQRLASSTALRLDHKPSTGFSSGAYAGRRSTTSQCRWRFSQARMTVLRWAGNLGLADPGGEQLGRPDRRVWSRSRSACAAGRRATVGMHRILAWTAAGLQLDPGPHMPQLDTQLPLL